MKNLLYSFLDTLLAIENSIVGKKKWLSRILEKESYQLISILIYYAFVFALVSFTLLTIDISIYLNFVLIFVFSFIVLKTLMIWRERQRGTTVVKIRQKEELKNFNFSISSIIFQKLYFNLTKHNILDEAVVKKNSFIKIFLDDFEPYSEVIDFQIEVAQIKYLFEKLIKTDTLIKSNRFLSGFRSLQYVDFENSKKFMHKGKFITSKQLSDNYGKAKRDNPTKLLEFQELIDVIFKESLDI